MKLDEAIEKEKWLAEDHKRSAERYKGPNEEKTSKVFEESAKEHEQLAEWLEKLKYIENIILKWNADWYNNEDTGIPDNEILEAIFNACTDNGFDISIDGDFREGYNKAIDDLVEKINHIRYVPVCVDCMTKHQIIEIAEQLKAGEQDVF